MVLPQSLQRTCFQPVVGRCDSASYSWRQRTAKGQPVARRQVAVRAQGGSAEDVAKLLEETNALVAQMSARVDDDDSAPRCELYCDDNGCVIMPSAAGASAGPTGSYLSSVDEDDGLLEDFDMLEGDGWKLGIDRAATSGRKYCGVVGSNSFTAAITLSEYDDFVQLLRALQSSVGSSPKWGAHDEEATLEMSTERVWMQGRAPNQQLAALQAAWKGSGPAPPDAFSLRFIFTGGVSGRREISGVWTASAVMDALNKLDGGNGVAAAAPADKVSAQA